MLPDLPGVITAAEIAATADAIAAVQLPDGAIPWEPDRHLDPWNHIEAAMALDVAGRPEAAARAYAWLRGAQRPDGSWAIAYRGGRPLDHGLDANFTAYVAVGTWHHFLATLDDSFLAEMWEPLRRAVECVLRLQAPGGEVWWARDGDGRVWPEALLTSSACIHLSLRCAVAAARELAQPSSRWEGARRRLQHAVSKRPSAFLPKARYAMDWYYPVLGGVLTGEPARARLKERWRDFVVEGLGVRCVADRPWVTVAETCELALAADAAGLPALARRLLGEVAARRHPSGAYWTGVTFPELEPWPLERPTWTAAAVLLAADAVARRSRTAGLFRGEAALAAEDLEAAG